MGDLTVFRVPVRTRPRRTAIAVIVSVLAAALLLAATAPGASAARPAEATYLNGVASTFDANGGGWTFNDNRGSCSGVICRLMEASFPSSTPPPEPADHYLHVESMKTDPSVTSQPPATAKSPAFIYDGVNGKPADRLSFRMLVNENFSAGDQVVGDTRWKGVWYSVVAVDITDGDSPDPREVVILPSRFVTHTGYFQVEESTSPNPEVLEIGRKYRLEIQIEADRQADAGGWVGFDDVQLTAERSEDPSDPGTDPKDPGGGDPKPGDASPPAKAIPEGTGLFYKNRLFIRIRCPRGYRPKCNIRAQGVTRKKRGKATTRAVRKGVKRGTWKKGGLLIKKKFRKRFRKFARTPHKRTAWVRLNVRSKKGKKKGKVFYHLRVKTWRAPAK